MKWYTCPYCGKKLFPYDEDHAICEGIKMKCKASNCRKIIDVVIKPKQIKKSEPVSL